MTLEAAALELPPARRPLNRFRALRARLLEAVYSFCLRLTLPLRPLFRRIAGPRLEALLRAGERSLKGLIFDCRMCGQCVLTSTGMSCPMTCPKTMRNGPCGGLNENGGCEIEPGMRCVWLDAWDGAGAMKRGGRIGLRQPALDHARAGASTWYAMMSGDHDTGREPPAAVPRETPRKSDRPDRARPGGSLAERLGSGKFCVTAEFNPADSTDGAKILAPGKSLFEVCDAVNVTDGAGGNTHISSVSICTLLERAGHEAVMQISCRDRNRIAIQAEAMGAAARGISNILCMTGDGVNAGDPSGAKAVFDLDCTSLLETLRTMRDEGRYASGRELEDAPDFFLGATSNPCGLAPEIEVERMAKKIAAGAQFLQTQYCFDLDAFDAFFDLFRARGLHQKVHYMVGVGPLKSAREARWIRHHIAGARIPDHVVERLESAADQKREGMNICLETINRMKRTEGVAGVHVMAFRQPEAAAQIIRQSGLAPLAT